MISDVLFKNSNIDTTTIAIKTSREVITYGRLRERITEFANYLVMDGITEQQRILIWLNNRPELIISFFAINLIGGIAILADTKFRHEIDSIIEENGVGLVITEKGQKDILPAYEGVKVINIDDVKLKSKDTEALEQYRKELKLEDGLISTILYTSGSTGKPKGVLNSHRNLKEALRNYTETMNFTKPNIFLGVVPFFHSYAFDSCMLAALHCGSTLFLMNSFVPAKVLRLIQEEKITIFHGVPFMYKLLNEQLKKASFDCSSLRLCISAGSRLEESCLREFYEATNKVIHQEYGSTETGTIAINLSNDLEMSIKYVGKPLQNIKLELISNEESEDTTLFVKSKGMAIGYLAEKPFDREGYRTKDLCIFEEEYLLLKGREDRLINITGLKVNPLEVENCLKQHSEIEDAFVKGTYSDDFGEAVEAVIVRKNENLTMKEVVAYCKRNLAAYKVPSIIKWVNTIEKTSMGKSRFT